MITDLICVKDGVVIEVDTNIDVVLNKFYRKFEEEFKEKITSRVKGFFLLNNWDYGKILKSVDLVKSIGDIPEIVSFEINFQTADTNNSGEIVTTRYYEIIRPSVITISFVYE